MTGGSPTSGADPPPIRCSIRSVIRTFWRARARLHAPDADDASGGRRCLAAAYGEKRGGVSRPPAFLHTLRRRCGRCHPAVRRCRRRHGSVVGRSLLALWSAPALPQWGRTAAVGGHCRSGGRTAPVGERCVQCLSRCLRRVQRRRRRRRARPLHAPCTRGDGGWEGRGSVGPGPPAPPQAARVAGDPTPPSGWRGSVGPGASGAVLGVRAGGGDGDARRPIGVGRRESAAVGVGRRNAVMSNAVDAAVRSGGARGGAVVSRRVGGVLTGVLAPLASSRAPAAARAAPARGGRGEVGKGADRRAWGVWRGPGGAGGCAVVIPWRGLRWFTRKDGTQNGRQGSSELSSPGGDGGGSRTR
jgi:hypothetical protein